MKDLEKRLRRCVGRAIGEYNLLKDGDVVLVGLSGGKDSFALLDILWRLSQRAPVSYRLCAVKINNHPTMEADARMAAWLAEHYPQIPLEFVEAPNHELINREKLGGYSACGYCARLRRGFLYQHARKVGATKLALGHHREDFNETLLLSIFFNGRIKAMPPVLRSDDGRHVVIRPLMYCAESDLAAWTEKLGFPVIDCPCNTRTDSQRLQIKQLLADLSVRHPRVAESLLAAQTRITPAHLADKKLFDFNSILNKCSIPSENELNREDENEVF